MVNIYKIKDRGVNSTYWTINPSHKWFHYKDYQTLLATKKIPAKNFSYRDLPKYGFSKKETNFLMWEREERLFENKKLREKSVKVSKSKRARAYKRRKPRKSVFNNKNRTKRVNWKRY